MGGSNQSKFEQIKDKYEIVNQIQDSGFGQVVVLKNKDSGERCYLKEYLFQDELEFNSNKKKLDRKSLLENDHIIKVYLYQNETDAQLCTTFYKTYLIFEEIVNNLEKEVNQRKTNDLHFPEQDIWIILEGGIDALAYLQRNLNSHNNIRPNQIFISKSGSIKLTDPTIFKDTSLFQSIFSSDPLEHRFVYLSPKLVRALKIGDVKPDHDTYKSDIFSFGMCMIQTCLLESCEDCYTYDRYIPKYEIHHDLIDKKLKRIGQRYSKQLEYIIRRFVTEQEEDRPDFILAQNLLVPSYPDQEPETVADQIQPIIITPPIIETPPIEIPVYEPPKRETVTRKYVVRQSQRAPEPVVEYKTVSNNQSQYGQQRSEEEIRREYEQKYHGKKIVKNIRVLDNTNQVSPNQISTTQSTRQYVQEQPQSRFESFGSKPSDYSNRVVDRVVERNYQPTNRSTFDRVERVSIPSQHDYQRVERVSIPRTEAQSYQRVLTPKVQQGRTDKITYPSQHTHERLERISNPRYQETVERVSQPRYQDTVERVQVSKRQQEPVDYVSSTRYQPSAERVSTYQQQEIRPAYSTNVIQKRDSSAPHKQYSQQEYKTYTTDIQPITNTIHREEKRESIIDRFSQAENSYNNISYTNNNVSVQKSKNNDELENYLSKYDRTDGFRVKEKAPERTTMLRSSSNNQLTSSYRSSYNQNRVTSNFDRPYNFISDSQRVSALRDSPSKIGYSYPITEEARTSTLKLQAGDLLPRSILKHSGYRTDE